MRRVRAEVFLADGRTDGRSDMTELIVVFRNFVNAPEYWLSGSLQEGNGTFVTT